MTKSEKRLLFDFYYGLEKQAEGVPASNQFLCLKHSLDGGAISVFQLIEKFGLMSEYYRYEVKRNEKEGKYGSSDSQDK